MTGISLSALISILGAVISAIAAAVSVASYRLRRRADKRAELKKRREDPSLSLYLGGATTEVVGIAGQRIWRFALRVINQSDHENSVVHAECRISYRTERGPMCTVAIPVVGDVGSSSSSVEALNIPLQLDGREARSGVLSFGAPDPALAGRAIHGYVIAVSDAYGREYCTESIYVREVSSGNEQASLEATDPID